MRTITRWDVFHLRDAGDDELLFKTTLVTKTSNSNGFTLVEIMIVVVIIGMLAAMAMPTFMRVRVSSQDKAVLNNARLLAGAADQYFMQNGTGTAAFGDLVGASNYVKSFAAVANEDYPSFFTAGLPFSVSNIGGNRTITYAY